jgi:acyl-CoA synthetase (AMP-forming)/AMP-acid ligase II
MWCAAQRRTGSTPIQQNIAPTRVESDAGEDQVLCASGRLDSDGWFDTGDTVRVDALGHLHFVNRARDVLRVAEENVAASEIEAVINRVNGVVECAVIGNPDDMLNELPRACWIRP